MALKILLKRVFSHPGSVCRTVRYQSQLINFDILRKYKAVFGDLFVPQRFIIGFEEAKTLKCPPYYIGFNLGKYVRLVESQMNRHEFDSSTMAELHALGMVTRDQVVQAAQEYVKKIGPGPVPVDFVIPTDHRSDWPPAVQGLHFGRIVSRMAMKSFYMSSIRSTLEQIGISVMFKSNSLLLESLKAFKNQFGHLYVPVKFVVPDNDLSYPPAAASMKLGRRLRILLANKSRLDPEMAAKYEELGVFSVVDGRQRAVNEVIAALEAFKAVHGHVRVPFSYIVPGGDAHYPSSAWGWRLGETVYKIRRKGRYGEFREQLERLGVEFNLFRPHFGFAQVYAALRAFKAVHGHLRVEEHFIVPEGDAAYPEGSHGMKLGQAVRRIRLRQTCRSQAEQQQKEEKGQQQQFQLGDVKIDADIASDLMDPSSTVAAIKRLERFEIVYAALETFKRLNGHVRVPEGFTVGKNDAEYPKEAWGLTLGQSLVNIRRRDAYSEHRDRLQQLGVDFTVLTLRRHSFDQIFSALKQFRDRHGHVDVPTVFVCDMSYTADVVGMKLGEIVSSIKVKDTFKQHRAQLQELGLHAAEKRPSFETIFEALQSFKLLHGHVNVPVKYEVAIGDVAYSASAWGLKLGSKTRDIRLYRTFKEQRQRLEDLGVVYCRGV